MNKTIKYQLLVEVQEALEMARILEENGEPAAAEVYRKFGHKVLTIYEQIEKGGSCGV